jgi:hypothetical protein
VALRAHALAARGARAVTRRHRLLHATLWPVLAAVVALGFTMALALRPPPSGPAPAPPPPSATEAR